MRELHFVLGMLARMVRRLPVHTTPLPLDDTPGLALSAAPNPFNRTRISAMQKAFHPHQLLPLLRMYRLNPAMALKYPERDTRMDIPVMHSLSLISLRNAGRSLLCQVKAVLRSGKERDLRGRGDRRAGSVLVLIRTYLVLNLRLVLRDVCPLCSVILLHHSTLRLRLLAPSHPIPPQLPRPTSTSPDVAITKFSLTPNSSLPSLRLPPPTPTANSCHVVRVVFPDVLSGLP
jgi:hypothetical protein